MNFLAHSFLSPDDELICLGNTFGDFVKGKKMLGVHPQLIKGVRLHRYIDDYTDNHPKVKEVLAVFKPYFGRFSGIIADMVFDYFLAKNWLDYSHQNLEDYVTELFEVYDKNKINLTERINTIAPVMKMQEWLLKYQTIEGLEDILRQMSRRIGNRVALYDAIPVILQNEQQLKVLFTTFFNDLIRVVTEYSWD